MPMTTLPPAPAPWQTLIDEWARSLRAENKSRRTIRTYTDAARWFHIWLASPTAPPQLPDPATWLASVPAPPQQPGHLDAVHVRAWIAYRLETTSAGNANNNYRALQTWFNWLLEEEEISHHPMARMKPPQVPLQPVPVTSDDVMRAVLAVCAGDIDGHGSLPVPGGGEGAWCGECGGLLGM
ncbi:MAG: phage integrase N-terminal SAM-like domain-containing protein, partial [Pseudonocardiales bacterium]|nr:phage integrase N-terminal SAM-like domain-containing protein [Pseudonocardiales bacterium]